MWAYSTIICNHSQKFQKFKESNVLWWPFAFLIDIISTSVGHNNYVVLFSLFTCYKKAADVVSYMELKGLTYAWIGAKDNFWTNNMVFLGSGDTLPDNSNLWAPSHSQPDHGGSKNCVYSSRSCCNGLLLTYSCTSGPDPFFCEKY